MEEKTSSERTMIEDILLRKHEKLADDSYLFDIVQILQSFKTVKTASFYDVLKSDRLALIGGAYRVNPVAGEACLFGETVKKFAAVADALSIVTEERYFCGSPADITIAREISSLPVMMNDFIVSPIHIFRAKELGASAVLLMVGVLTATELREYIKIVAGLKMDAVVQADSPDEARRAVACGARIVSVSNADMNNGAVDFERTRAVARAIPQGVKLISMGGFRKPEDALKLEGAKVDGLVIAEGLRTAEDSEMFCREIREAYDAVRMC